MRTDRGNTTARPRPRSETGVGDRNTTNHRKDSREERVEKYSDPDGRRDVTDEPRDGNTKELNEDQDEESGSSSAETRSALTEFDRMDYEALGPGMGCRRGWSVGCRRPAGQWQTSTVVFVNEEDPIHDPQRCQPSLDNGWHNTNPETKAPRSVRELKRETTRNSHHKYSV